MTNTTMSDEVLKSDVLGRVRTPPERREALLDEFERSGLTGQKFAALVGVKYQTFASWRHKRQKNPGRDAKPKRAGAAIGESKPIQWLEAVAETGEARELQVDLPGGASVKIRDGKQAALAARLLRELAMIERPC
jgi:hypothetical protein